MPSISRNRKRSASCTNLPFGHLRPDTAEYTLAIDIGVWEYSNSFTDADLDSPYQHHGPYFFETIQALENYNVGLADSDEHSNADADLDSGSDLGSGSESGLITEDENHDTSSMMILDPRYDDEVSPPISGSTLDALDGNISTLGSQSHTSNIHSQLFESTAQNSTQILQLYYQYSAFGVMVYYSFTLILWDIDRLSITAKRGDNSLSSGMSKPKPKLLTLPTEILQNIIGLLIPLNRSSIILTSLQCVGPGLSDCLMSLRLTSKAMQTVVKNYWTIHQRQTGLIDSPSFGLINPKETTWIFNADQFFWNCNTSYIRPCSFRPKIACFKPDCLKSAYNCIQGMPLAARRLIQNVVLRLYQFDRVGPGARRYEAISSLFTVLKESLPFTTRVEIQYFENPRPLRSWVDFINAAEAVATTYGDHNVYVPKGIVELDYLRAWNSPVVVYDAWGQGIAKREFDMEIPMKLRSVWVPPGQKVRIGGGNNFVEVGRGDEIERVVVTGPVEPGRVVGAAEAA